MTFIKPDILIVEDEALNRDLMARRLQARDYNLHFAENGSQARDRIQTGKPDLILLDIMMPDISGLELLHELRQTWSMVDLPIIMVTALDDDERLIQALELGANDYITKPINFPVLIARIQTQLSLSQLAALNREFLATAGHDLSRPLQNIYDIANQSRLKLNAQHACDTDLVMDDMNRICDAVKYMHNITSCILDMQASGFGQIRLTRTPIQMEKLVEEVAARHNEYAHEKRIGISVQHGYRKPVVEADRPRLTQVLDKLLDNAIKYCSAGDIITLAVYPEQDQLHVVVSDTGPGLPQELVDQLFTPQRRCDDKLPSGDIDNGINLFVCRQLIELHEGLLQASNNPQHGVTFHLTLPLFRLKPVE